MVWRKHLEKNIILAREFYEIFVEHSFMAASVVWTFEFRIHSLLRQGRTIQIFPIKATGGNQLYRDYKVKDDPESEESESLELPRSEEHVFYGGATVIKVGRYYRPESSTFPAIDALLLIKPAGSSNHLLLLFKITRDKRSHDVKGEDLLEVKRLKLPKGTKTYYVAVTPEDLRLTITVDKTVLEEVGKGGPDEAFPVYRYPIDI